MSLQLSIENRGKYLYAALSGGAVDMAQAKELFKRILDSSVEHRVSRVLIDCRGVSTGISTTARFEFAGFMAEQQRRLLASSPSTASRIAFVGNPPLIDPERFGETVALNRGANVKVADNMDDALGWLDLDDTRIREEPAE